MKEATYEKRCKELILIRNTLQKENDKLMKVIGKITYLIKLLDQKDIDYELRKFYLFLEKKKWVKTRNTMKVIQSYKSKGSLI